MTSTFSSSTLLDANDRDLPWEDSDVTTDDDVATDTLTPDQFESAYAGEATGDGR